MPKIQLTEVGLDLAIECSRRRFLIALANSGFFIGASGFSRLAWSAATLEQIERNYASIVFDDIQRSEAPYKLLNDVFRADRPLDPVLTRILMGREYTLRWRVTEAVSRLSNAELLEFLPKIPTWPPGGDKKRVIELITAADIRAIPYPTEIMPISLPHMNLAVSKSLAISSKLNPCLRLIGTVALAALDIAVDDVEKILDILDGEMRAPCIEIYRSARKADWEEFKENIFKLGLILVSGAVLQRISAVIGKEATKRLLKAIVKKCVPAVGAFFFVVQLALGVKDNWTQIRDRCKVD